MLAITYAYEPEVKVLKGLVEASDFASRVIWHRWSSKTDLPDNVNTLVNVGFAGALNPDLALGEVVFVDEVMGSENGLVKIDSALQKNVELKKVRLLTRAEPVLSAALRDELYVETKADIVDMEGSFLLEAARSKSVPLVIFKVVSDMADNDAWQMIKQNANRWSEALGQTNQVLLDSFSRNCPTITGIIRISKYKTFTYHFRNICSTFKNHSQISLDYTCDYSAIRKVDPKNFWHIQCILEGCLNNIQKHSEATKVAVDIKKENGSLVLQVKDNGIGISNFKPQTTKNKELTNGLGLKWPQ